MDTDDTCWVSAKPNREEGVLKMLSGGDEHCRGVRELMQDYKVQLKIQTVIKPNALFEDVIKDVAQMARGFGKEDILLIFAGTQNALHKKELDIDLITEVIHLQIQM